METQQQETETKKITERSAALFSSAKDDWATPQEFFDKLNEEFAFDPDPCASEENHKTELFFTKEQNGLLQDWGGPYCFCKSTIRQEVNGRMDREVREGSREARNNGRYAYTGPHRHDRFSRIHIPQGRNSLRERSLEIRRKQRRGAVSVNVSYFQKGKLKK